MIYDTQMMERVHPGHQTQYQRWRFLLDSYMGGFYFRKNDYLTRYVYESESEYDNRKQETPLDNHCKNIIHTYSSFLFREAPYREMGSLERDPNLPAFMQDADLDGRNFNNFMRDACVMASIYGTAWICVDKPETQTTTRAQELEQQIRPYVSLISPINVVDWDYERRPNGAYELVYAKVFERHISETEALYRIYTKETIDVVSYDKGSNSEPTRIISSTPNALGIVPLVVLYNTRSWQRGIGVSDIEDIADQQLKIFNLNSELIQLARISNHPSLVKTEMVKASAGAGAIITVPENTPEGLKPYLLQPDSDNIDGLLDSIEKTVETIDKLAHLGGIRSTATRSQSGVALQSEFQLLQAKLTEKASGLQLAEEQIWRLWALWQDTSFDGIIEYTNTYNMRDKTAEIEQIKLAKDSGINNSLLLQALDNQLAEILLDDEELIEEITNYEDNDDVIGGEINHDPVEGVADLLNHLREMIAEGYSDAEIIELHPELEELFNDTTDVGPTA